MNDAIGRGETADISNAESHGDAFGLAEGARGFVGAAVNPLGANTGGKI
ncbi:hypothetical protein NKH74_28175 [Mesorhizobium sp. M0933]